MCPADLALYNQDNGRKISDDDRISALLPIQELEIQAAAEEAARKHKKAKGGRKITARCWMAENFPLSLAQLLPLLEIIGSTNKHIKRVRAHTLCFVSLQTPTMAYVELATMCAR